MFLTFEFEFAFIIKNKHSTDPKTLIFLYEIYF